MAETTVRPRRASRVRSLLATVTTALFAVGGLVVAPVTAQAAETPQISVDVTEVANEKIVISATGSGFGDVVPVGNPPRQHVYLGWIEKGTDLSEIDQSTPMPSVAVYIKEDGTFDGDDFWSTFEEVVENLDRSKDYEVISWPARSNPSEGAEGNLYARADAEVDWDALFPAPAPTPEISVDVTEVANEKIVISATGSGFGDVVPVGNPPRQHVYLGWIEKGTDLSEIDQSTPMPSVAVYIKEDGTFDGDDFWSTFEEVVENLDRSKDYEVISWPARSNPSEGAEGNLYARADAEVDWDALFPVPEPVYEPVLTVTPNTSIDPAGASVTVTGEGYNPNQAIYVTTCADVELDAVDFDFINNGCTSGAKLVWGHDSAPYPGADEFDADGAFELEMTVTPRAAADATALYTIANHTAQQDRGQDAKASLGFNPAHETETVVTVNPENAVYGDDVLLTAEITPTTAVGTVAFFAGEEQIGESTTKLPLIDATLTTDGLPAGVHEITAEFTPLNSKSFESSETEDAATLTIDKAETQTALEAAPAQPSYGDTVELTASVSPATEGTVEFFNGATSLGSEDAASGTVTIDVDGLAAGTHELTAEFTSADNNYEGSESTVLSLEIAKAETDVTLTVPATVELGTTTTLSADASVAGTVAFFEGDNQIGDSIEVDGEAATVETGELNETEYSFKVVFTPADEENYEASEDEKTVQTIDHSEATITVNGEEPDTVTAGERVVFAAGPFAEGTEVSAEVHSDPIDLGTATVDANGMVSFAWTVPADFLGDHEIVFTTDGGTELSAAFTVVAASSGSDDGTGGSGDSSANGSGLATTGTDGIAGLAVGALVLLAGMGVMLAARRKTVLQD
ncbi:MAG: Ig-like domain repeat protein [Leucobacter sp.]